MEKVCKEHQKTPAIIYGQCIGCELDGLRKQLKMVQSHAKSAMDKLPGRWNEGFQTGLKSQASSVAVLQDRLRQEIQARKDDNAALTADILKLEEENERLRRQLESR